jgi:hypothetical protein
MEFPCNSFVRRQIINAGHNANQKKKKHIIWAEFNAEPYPMILRILAMSGKVACNMTLNNESCRGLASTLRALGVLRRFDHWEPTPLECLLFSLQHRKHYGPVNLLSDIYNGRRYCKFFFSILGYCAKSALLSNQAINCPDLK